MADEQGRRYGQEGNRWVNMTPTAEELADWFEKNVKVEGELKHADYVGGVVLIPATEKTKRVTGWEGLKAVIEDAEDLVFTPYIRVETRLKYFHDFCAIKKYKGFIDPAEIEKPDRSLPAGFFRRAVATGEGREARYIGCSMRVTMYEGESVREIVVTVDKRSGEQAVVRTGDIAQASPAGTKTVPTVKSGRSNTIYADDNAVMKAETGAIGRALGMAGMLVIPGSGIATAEDVQESRAAEAAGPAADGAVLPDEPAGAAVISDPASAPDSDEAIRVEITTILGELETSFPEAHAQFLAWAKEKKYGRLAETVSPQLRGMHRRITHVYNEAAKEKKAAVSGADAAADPLAE